MSDDEDTTKTNRADSGIGTQGDRTAAIKQKFADFFSSHPSCQIEARRDKYGILPPWNDGSLVIVVPQEEDELASALNAVCLPERYSAIWHKDTKDLEIIFTAFKLSPDRREVHGRTFTFNHNGVDYACGYGAASERLMIISKAVRPAAESTQTNYRNLESFWLYHHAVGEDLSEDDRLRAPIGEPICFWIKEVDWDEDNVLLMISNLNFYMTYYDARSPHIIIHAPKLESAIKHSQERYVIGRFPEKMSSRELDDAMLRYWMASRSGDPFSKFLYAYRIVEYASSFYLESSARQAVRRALSAPHALDDITRLMEKVLNAVQGTNIEPVQKFELIVDDAVDASLLWREIEKNKGYFTQEVRFDGGFIVKPLIAQNTTEADFARDGKSKFSKFVRGIRNALSHGKDQRTSLFITPTTHNFERLQPWAVLMTVAAGEVILYRDIS